MKPVKVTLSTRPYRVGSDYPYVTVVFDYDVAPLEGVMWALSTLSTRKLRKTKEDGYNIGVSSVWEDQRGTGPAWLSVSLPIRPGQVQSLQTYIEEATKIAEVEISRGLNLRVAIEAEKERMGDGIVVELFPDVFRYKLKGARYVTNPYDVPLSVDEQGKVEQFIIRDPEKVRKSLQMAQDEAAAEEAETDKYTPEQRDEMYQQQKITEKEQAAETRVAVEKLRTDAADFNMWREQEQAAKVNKEGKA